MPITSGSISQRLAPQYSDTTSALSLCTPFDIIVTLPGSREERRHLDYFHRRTVPDFNSCFSSEFWDRLVLQVSHDDVAVRHALVALAAMHEHCTSVVVFKSGGSLAYSTEKYTKALSSLRKQIEDHPKTRPETALICCILFIAFETLRGQHNSAILHFQNGLRILSHAQATNDHVNSGGIILDDLVPVLLRLNVQARSLLRPFLPNYDQLEHQGLPDVITTFTNLTQARDVLSTMYNAGFSIFQAFSTDTRPECTLLQTDVFEPGDVVDVPSQYDHLRDLFAQWIEAFDDLLETQGSSLNIRELKGAIVLRIHYISGIVVLNTCMDPGDRGFDAWTDQFKQIISLSKSLIEAHGSRTTPTFSIDMGIIAPLFLVVTSCRDPLVRRNAAHLLQTLPRQEGAWDAAIAAKVGAWVIAIEEEGLGLVKSASDVPMSSRVQRFGAEVSVERKQIRLIPKFGAGNKVLNSTMKELWVDWTGDWKWPHANKGKYSLPMATRESLPLIGSRRSRAS